MSRTTPRLLIPYPDDNTAPWDAVFEAMILAIDASLYVPREDRNIVIFGGGTVSFNATTGVLSWSADIGLLSSVTGYKWVVPAGSVTLNDGQLFYITVARAPQTNTTNTPTVASNTPNQPSGDNQILVGIRVGTNVHFRDGFVISDGQSQILFDGSGGGFTPGGDLAGTSTNQTVVGWEHKALDAVTMGAPSTGYVPVYDGVAQKWKAQAGSSLFTPGGDLSGNATSQTVIGWETKPLDATSFGAPTDAQIPIWNNSSTKWFSVSISGDVSLTNAGVVTVVKLQNRAVSATAPSTGSFLGWDGAQWIGRNAVASLQITGLASGMLGVDGSGNVVKETSLPLPKELSFVAGVFSTNNSTFTRMGSRIVDLSPFPTTLADGRTLHAAIVFDFETTAGTATIRLQNITDNETVTGTSQTTSSVANTEVSVSLTIGSSAGNLKTGKTYEVQLELTGGSALDRATVTNSRLVLTYS